MIKNHYALKDKFLSSSQVRTLPFQGSNTSSNLVRSIKMNIENLKLRLAKVKFDMPRKWDKKHCMSKSCDEMGFSEKASCRPYKNCYKK